MFELLFIYFCSPGHTCMIIPTEKQIIMTMCTTDPAYLNNSSRVELETKDGRKVTILSDTLCVKA